MYTFSKKYRLCDRNVIDQLFLSGKTLRTAHFIVRWDNIYPDADSRFRVLITVGKKNVKQANRRNYLRRIIREALRLNMTEFRDVLEKTKENCAMALIYTGPEKPPYSSINSKILLLLQRLRSEYESVAG